MGRTKIGSSIAWGARRLCRRRTIAGGFGEAERSERGGDGRWGAEGRSEPSQGSHVREVQEEMFYGV
jgi:hypothetical protein